MSIRAVQVVTTDGPESLVINEIPEPTPGPDEVLVDVHAVGISFPDLLLSRGQYQLRPEPPFTLGVDFAGTVVTEGHGFTAGQRVCGVLSHGGAAERAVAHHHVVFALPEGLPSEDGDALPLNYPPAPFPLPGRGPPPPWDRLPFHG